MEGNIVSVYKKIKLLENVYIYKFIMVLEDVEYDEEDNTISYYKKGKQKVLYSMEDGDFTISDEKYCFGDLVPKQEFIDVYKIDARELKQTFERECCNYIRYGILEEESLKIIDSRIEDIRNAKCEEFYINYAFSYQIDEGALVHIPLSSVQEILFKLKEEQSEEVCTFLEYIVSAFDTCEEFLDENCKAAGNKTDGVELNIEEALNSLIGLKMIKRQVQKLKNYLVFVNKVKEELKLEFPNLNMVFLGNPGTEKTTVAKILAQMLYELGYVKVNKVAEVTARDFIAEYEGQTAQKTQEVLNEYRGGVIFIDEAYVFSSEGQQYADEALVEIIKEMEEKETVFIFAGYQAEMKRFIQMNPGLTSRIGYHMEFPDYTLDELYSIFLRKISKSKFQMDEKIGAKVKLIILDFMKQEHFGNGRFIDNLFDKIVMSHANRCYNSDNVQDLITITEEDISVEICEELKSDGKTKQIGF